MEYVPLGRTDAVVSRIAFGGAAIGGYDYGRADDAESIRAIRAAVESGITLFDTADIYGFGRSEEILGRALAPFSDALIATKVGVRPAERASQSTVRDLSPAHIRAALSDSLRRLKRDCIDLYQIHWPDSSTPIEATVEALRRCQEAGMVRHLGLCNLGVDQIREFLALGRFETIQLPFGLAQPDHATLLRACQDEWGLSSLVYNALAHGFFAGSLDRDRVLDSSDLRQRTQLLQGKQRARNDQTLGIVRDIGIRRQRSPAQIALRWALDQPFVRVVLAGVRTADQAIDNAGAAGWALEQSDLERLSRAAMSADIMTNPDLS